MADPQAAKHKPPPPVRNVFQVNAFLRRAFQMKPKR